MPSIHKNAPFQTIADFGYVKGHKYTLLVEKTTLSNPPADAYNVKYKLISVLEESPVEFPTLEVKDLTQIELNGYKANIFEPVHFYLNGNEHMQEDLRELCDSLVFDVMGRNDGTAKVYYHKTGEAKLISGWDHRFYFPINAMCRIQAYKNGKVVYTHSKQIQLHNDKDFLMYNWNEITQNAPNNIGYVNFLNPKLEIISTHYITQNTPVAKMTLSEYSGDTGKWLSDYINKLYKNAAVYDKESGVTEKFKELFVSPDNRETPQYIWVTDKSAIALVNWYHPEVEVSSVYLMAQPLKK